MIIETESIRPKVNGESDFFSWQLYRWVKKYSPYKLSVWAGTWNPISGIDPGKTTLFIGDMYDHTEGDKWLHGRMLRNLCTSGGGLHSWAYGPGYDTANWEDVTDQFWDNYMRIGVCAIHGDSSHNWSYSSDQQHRGCLNCGKEENKLTELVERHYWE